MENKRTLNPAAVLVIMLISMVAGAICMNKMSPVLSFVMADLGITTGQSGILISIFTLSGIFLSIPMGVLTTRYGVFKTGLFSLIAIVAGSALGAVAQNYGLMLFSRFIEGIGLMFLVTIGPASVGSAFSDEKRGTAMGLLMCFMSFGQIIALNIAPVMAESSSWRNFWWLSAAFGAVGLILWILFIRRIDEGKEGQEEKGADTGTVVKEVLANKGVWLTAFTFFAFMIAHMGVFNYMPTYLTEAGGVSAAAAGSLTSIASLIGIPVGILGGFLADRWGSRKKPLVLTMVLLGVLIAVIPLFSEETFVILMVLYGIVSMAQAGYCMTAASEVVKEHQRGSSTGVVNTGQWAGAFLGSMIFSACLSQFGWNVSFYIMAVIAAAGALATACNSRLK